MEKLAQVIRANMNIKGIDLQGEAYKLSQYADDLSLFCRNGPSLEVALGQIQDFGTYSGLQLNLNKSVGLNIKAHDDLLQKGNSVLWSQKINVLDIDFYSTPDEGQRTLTDFQK